MTEAFKQCRKLLKLVPFFSVRSPWTKFDEQLLCMCARRILREARPGEKAEIIGGTWPDRFNDALLISWTSPPAEAPTEHAGDAVVPSPGPAADPAGGPARVHDVGLLHPHPQQPPRGRPDPSDA